MNISVILSGGAGTRFGGGLSKQYQLLLGLEVIAYSVRALKQSALTDRILIVAGQDYVEQLASDYSVTCIAGAASRNGSLRKALEFIHDNFPECKHVFINEAARPFLTAEMVDTYYRYLDDFDAVITAQHITDSLGREGETITDRAAYYLIQAPEAFQFGLLYKYFSADSAITATVQQLPLNRKVKKYFDFKHNIKITYPEDLLYAEHLMKLYY
jgi:2-C-methyl-D-erythritol 4-phosphate cytidylyltransferase